jgi:hypothetical protein
VTISQHYAFRRVDDPADDVDKRGLARAVGTEQREDLTPPYLQVDLPERPKAGGVGLGEAVYGDDGPQGQAPASSVVFTPFPAQQVGFIWTLQYRSIPYL